MAISGVHFLLPEAGNIVSSNSYYRFSWSEVSRSFEDNTSTIKWSLGYQPFSVGTTFMGNQDITLSVGNYRYTFQIPSGRCTEYTHLADEQLTTVSHNADGTLVLNITIQVKSSLTGNTITDSVNIELDPIVRKVIILDAPNFNDEENPVLIYEHPHYDKILNLEACISISSGRIDDISYRKIPMIGGFAAYTFMLTDEERKILRQAVKTGSSIPITYVIRQTQLNGAYVYTNVTRTLTLVNHTPILAPVIRATDTKTHTLTGSDGDILIRHASTVGCSINAQARKEATITHRRITCGSYTTDTSGGVIYNLDNNQFSFSATDSRGFTVRETVEIKEEEGKFVPYTKLTANLGIKLFEANGNLTFSIDGNYYNGNFGAEFNSLAITYTLKKNGQDVETVTLNPQTQGSLSYGYNDTYNYEYMITGLAATDPDGTYNGYAIKATVSDKIGSITTESVQSTAIPVFDWGADGFNFNVPVHFGRGFTDDVGLKIASAVRTIDINKAGSFPCWDLAELGITYDNNVYSISGAIAYENKIYPVPSPALSNGVGAYSIVDATKLWIEGDQVYITTGAAWGAVSVRIVIMYF